MFSFFSMITNTLRNFLLDSSTELQVK